MADKAELFEHSARCARLAEQCLDPCVAKQLWRLAVDYRLQAEDTDRINPYGLTALFKNPSVNNRRFRQAEDDTRDA
jgi:hypothetical protein